MIIRNKNKRIDTKYHLRRSAWDSIRLLTDEDCMGFSFHITTIYKGETRETQYLNHVEAVYCISGKATLIYDDGNEKQIIESGVLYGLDQHDCHSMIIEEDITLACVFMPALSANQNANN